MKKYILILFLLFPLLCQAKPINEKYSFKLFPYHGGSFKDVDASEFNDTIIKGSCFYQEWVKGDAEVEKDIFPDGMTGVTFERCNLDNVLVPVGNNAVRGINRLIKVQHDWDDWILKKADKKPKEPVNKKQRLKKGISIDPNDIPKNKWTKEERKAYEDILDGPNI